MYRGAVLKMRLSSVCRVLLYLVVGCGVVELFILNIVIIYSFISLKQEFNGVFKSSSDLSVIDKLVQRPLFRDLIYQGKNGGFRSLLQETLERVYIVSEPCRSASKESHFLDRQISYLGFDVSRSGEANYLQKRIQSRASLFSDHYKLLIVDIGANDGLMSSNSFNFIQRGWNATLVEPQVAELNLAKANIERYIDPYNENKQKVRFVNCVIGDHDGVEDFVLQGSSLGMESHVYDPQRAAYEAKHKTDTGSQLIVKVQSMTVPTFANKYKVPVNFGILSIDAEGFGDKILRQWIDSGFRPAYILYEQLRNKEPLSSIIEYLQENGYRFLTTRGWNYIFEHNNHLEE